MDKNHLIELTNKLYRLTLRFPKKEPLRNRMRALSIDALAALVKNLQTDELEVLDCFLEVAKAQKWVKGEEILLIQQEYSKLKGQKSEPEPVTPAPAAEAPVQAVRKQEEMPAVLLGERPLIRETVSEMVFRPDRGLNNRQSKILSVLKEKERAQVGEFTNIFPDVDKRTLRRDFRSLMEQGLVERLGERNDTFYRLRV